MVFKRMLGTFGVGGPSVDTVLDAPCCTPGERLAGEVRIAAADYDVAVQGVTLALVVGDTEVQRAEVSGAFTLPAGKDRTIPFRLAVPWETPLTEIDGRRLYGVDVGVRTELAVARAVDKGDLDMVAVRPLPSQERILAALAGLGFHFKDAEIERGGPFRQEIEFYPPGEYHGRIDEVEVTMTADPGGLSVVLEADRHGGEAVGRFRVSHEDALRMDWAAEITAWLESVADRHGGMHAGYGAPAYGAPAYGDPSYGAPSHGHHHEDHERRRGPGWGGVAAGAAAGVAAGVVGGMVFDEIFEDDEEEG